MALRTFLLFLAALAGFSQVRPLQTRDLTRLSQIQLADQLTRSDVIFIPVGAVETNGMQPSGRDYVSPLAFAMLMAEETGGLYMPGLPWSYPGTTLVAPSTIYMTTAQGVDYLRGLAKSLLRQGFRRQVYLSFSQGPAPLTAGALVREFFDETRVPILYIEIDKHLQRHKLNDDFRHKQIYGAHWITGRIEDLPLKGDYGARELASSSVPPNEGLAALSKLGFSGSLTLGSWINDVMAHGGGSELVLPATASEREQWGREGKSQLVDLVKQMLIPEAMDALRKHDRYTQDVIVPKLGKYLPGPADHR